MTAVRLIEGGGVYVVETRAPVGAELQSHRHAHEHVSVLASGRAVLTVETDDEVRVSVLDGYSAVTIPAGVAHRVQAVTDIVWLCVWAASLAPRREMDEFIGMLGCAGCPGGCEPA